MAEEFINCRNCGRAVPKTMYCIYCGSGLQGGELLRPEAQEQPTEAIIPDFKFEPLRQTPVSLKVESPFPLIRTEPELDKGFLDQIEELRKHWAWQLKLVDMITEIGVSEEVFTKIYNEYSTEVERLGNILEERRAASSEEYARKKAELSEMETAHEELSVRVAVGQLPSRALQRRTPISKERMDGLTRDIKRLETTLSKLDDLMGDIYPEDKRNLEDIARKSLRSLDGLVVEGKISRELSERLREDLTSALALFRAPEEKRETESALRDELETLEVRYKVGEITLEEFESLKTAILDKINRL
ncbi:hypothetical protein ISS40_06535 [Candidatus Bathyarchaeota archaeon]|nr:hypothetical protein [Candidatus Bathyarchaeota archaeon]MBL7168314.1 hypothetical protein [Candidatus Bathyarchaeota archaeon]